MRENEARDVDRAGIGTDNTAFLAVVDTFFPPRDAEQRSFVRYAHDHVALFDRLAPYDVSRLAGGYLSAGERLRICVRPPNETWPCDPYVVAPPAKPLPAYAITEPAPGIAQLTIGDLSSAATPAWAGFATDAARLAKAKALVLDLREAAGDDPRHLLPWLEQVTGRAPLRPLAAIQRPASTDAYAAAYKARFSDVGRDPAVWSQLVGTMPAARGAWTKPIGIIVGPRCHAACELAARVLETYAGAFVLGTTGESGRLRRDEPAMLTLPHSKVDIYFFATTYLLAPAIEAATGPTHVWNAWRSDAHTTDLIAAALSEIQVRRANRGGWPQRCDALPAYTKRSAMPPAMQSKIDSERYLDRQSCREGTIIRLETRYAFSTVRRFASTCTKPPSLGDWSSGTVIVHSSGPSMFPVLSQLAQSELVTGIRISCDHRPEPN